MDNRGKYLRWGRRRSSGFQLLRFYNGKTLDGKEEESRKVPVGAVAREKSIIQHYERHQALLNSTSFQHFQAPPKKIIIIFMNSSQRKVMSNFMEMD